MKIRLLRKFANLINGVDLSKAHAGETLDLPERDAGILLAEGWASKLKGAARARDKAQDRGTPQPKPKRHRARKAQS